MNDATMPATDSSAEVWRSADVPEADLADRLSDDERVLLGQALSALRRERGKAWNAACDLAESQGKRRPPLKPYGIDDIQRLARRFGTNALPWTEC